MILSSKDRWIGKLFLILGVSNSKAGLSFIILAFVSKSSAKSKWISCAFGTTTGFDFGFDLS